MTHTLCEWQLAIAAYAYETTDRPTLSDNSYDRMAQLIGERGSTLPGFTDITGQWVHNMDAHLLGKLLTYALSINDGKEDLHGPAVKAALDKHGVAYTCCHSDFNCWDDGGEA